MERQDGALAVVIDLLEYGTTTGPTQRVGVVEAAHPGERAEVMIEGAVLLHQDDEMIDIAKAARGGAGGRNAAQHCRSGQRGSALKKPAARYVNHAHSPKPPGDGLAQDR